MKKAILLGCVVLAGCAIAPEYFRGPNGKDAYVMRCSGLGRTLAECYRTADRLCPGGYNIINQSNTSRQVDYDRAITVRDLTIECK